MPVVTSFQQIEDAKAASKARADAQRQAVQRRAAMRQRQAEKTANAGRSIYKSYKAGKRATSQQQNSSGRWATPGGRQAADAQAAAVQAAAIARQAAIEKARQKAARIARKQKRILTQASRRGERIQQRVEARMEEINQARLAINRQLQVLNSQLVRASSPTQRSAIIASQNVLRTQLLAYDRKAQDAQRGYNRFNANTQLQLKTSAGGEPLTATERRERRRVKAKATQQAIQESTIPDLARARYSQRSAGEAGRGAELRAAVRSTLAYQQTNPANFDETTLVWLGEELDRHEKAVAARYQKFADETKTQAEIMESAKPGSQRYNRALAKARRAYEEVDMETYRREFNLLYGPIPKTNVKGTKVPNTKKGLLWEFAIGTDIAYQEAQKYRDSQMFGSGLVGAIRKGQAAIVANVYHAYAESTRKNVYDPVAGVVRKQTVEQRMTEILRMSGANQEESNTLGQQRTIDYLAAQQQFKDDPILSHVYDQLIKEGVTSNQELTGTYGIEKIESRIIPQAQKAAFDAWKLSDKYQVPGEAEGIFDYSRYGRDSTSEYFTLPNGDVVRPGEPLPAGFPEPRWNHMPDPTKDIIARFQSGDPQIGGNDSLQTQYGFERKRYEDKTNQTIEDTIRLQLGVVDPGFLGDVFRTTAVGELVGLPDAIPGAAALMSRVALDADLGLNFGGDGKTAIEREGDRFKGYTFAAGATSDEIFKDTPIKGILDFVGVSSRSVVYTDEDGGLVLSAIGNYPVIGPVEFTVHKSPAISKEIKEQKTSFDKAMEDGDILMGARILGTNGFVQFGNASGLLNFAAYMALDPTNFLPGVSLAKRGLAGVRAAALAGRVPNSALGRLASMSHAFSAGVKANPRVAQEVAGLAKDIARLAPNSTKEQQLAALRAVTANLDITKEGDALIDDFVEKLSKHFGLDRYGVDKNQLRNWAQEHIATVLRNRNWIVENQTDEALRNIESMERVAEAAKAEQRSIDTAVGLRNAQYVEDLAVKGRAAVRAQADVRRAGEAFEQRALELARDTSARRLEELAVKADPGSEEARLYARARDLKRRRGGGTAESGGATRQQGTGARVDFSDPDVRERILRGEDVSTPPKAKKLTKAQRDEALRLKDAEEAKNLAARRAIRLDEQRRLRTIEVRERAAAREARANEPIQQIGRLATDPYNGSRLYRAVPDAWTESTGPNFWSGIVDRGFRSTRRATNVVIQEATQLVEAAARRHGRWDPSVKARKLFGETGLRAAMVGDGATANKRAIYAAQSRLRGVAPTEAGYAEFLRTATAAAPPPGSRRWAETFGQRLGDDIYEAYDTAVLNGTVKAGQFETTVAFLSKMQFGSGTADDAIKYVQRMRAIGDPSDDGWLLAQAMFVDDLNSFRQRLATSAVDLRSETFRELSETPLARLERFLFPASHRTQIEEELVQGAQRLSGRAVRLGYEGRDVNTAILALEEVLTSKMPLHVGSKGAEFLDTLAVTMVREQLLGEGWDISRRVFEALGRSPVATKAGQAARLLRERMHKELDLIGVDLADVRWVDSQGRTVTHFTTPESAAAIRREGHVPGAAASPFGYEAGQAALGPGIYFSLDDVRWSHRGDEPLEGVVHTLAADTRVLEITDFDQLVDLANSLGVKVPLYADDVTALTDALRAAGQYDGMSIAGMSSWPGVSASGRRTDKVVRGLGGDQMVVWNRAKVRVGVPLDGPSPARVATEQSMALMNAMGQSEAVWLQARLKRNISYINNPRTPRAERLRLQAETLQLRTAIKHVAVEKGLDRYVPPAMSYDEAIKAAEAYRARVAGTLPPRSYAVYAETAEQAQVEVVRGVYAALKETPVDGVANRVIEDVLDWFPMARYAELNDVVGQAVRQVQGKRASSLGIRKLDVDESDVADTLRSTRDTNPAVLKAKEDAIRAWTQANGLPDLPTEVYDRMRTLLQPHVSRGIRSGLIADEARRMPGDFSENFISIRQAKADDNAVNNIRWILLENPGMLPDEAVRQFELGFVNDGALRQTRTAITPSDARIYKEFFEASTGAAIDSQDDVIAALGAHGTKPAFDKKFSFRDHQLRTGEWSPRKADAIDDSRPAWSLEEERDFFMNRYGEAPRWVTDERILNGTAFKTREMYYKVMLETGNYDEVARVARILGEEEYTNFDDLAFGNPGRGIKPAKDWARERQWTIQRYGSLVSDDGKTLKEMPWLMTVEELEAYKMLNVGVDLGDVIHEAAEVAAVNAAMGRLAEKYVDAFIRTARLTDPAQLIVPSTAVNRMAFDMTRELAVTTPWRRFYTQLRNGNMLRAWGWFWRAMVVSNPAFVISNIIDTPTKAIWFSLTDRFAKRASARSVEVIPDVNVMGIQGTAYLYDAGSRGVRTRLARDTSYGNLDRMGAVATFFTTSLAKKVLQPVEYAVKTRLARQIWTGLMDEFGPGLRAAGYSDEVVEQLILLRTKDRILRLFPSLDNAGPAERILNQVFPFISYNIKNKILWISEFVEHPWMIDVVNELQYALIQHNQQEWAKQHPENPIMPEHLHHQIMIPGTDMTLDIGGFTDSARGAGFLFTEGMNVGEFIGTFIRPLPSQRAVVDAALFHMFGIGGRLKWEKTFDENGFWDGGYQQVVLPPGVPWGDRPLDILRDMVWPVNFAEAVMKSMDDGKMTWPEMVRSIGRLVTFGGFGEPSRYMMLNQQYFTLKEADEEAALRWLNDSEDGAELRELWNQKYWEPTDTKLGLAELPFPDGVNPTPEDIRKRWLSMQPPEIRNMFTDGWNEREWADQYWDERYDAATTAEERRHMWVLRETWFSQFYHARPYLWEYAAMGLNEEEFAQWRADMFLDRERDTFYSLYGWEKEPIDAKARAQWEKDREAWLAAHPTMLADLADVKDSFEESQKRRNHLIDVAVRTSGTLDRLRQAAYERDQVKQAELFGNLRNELGRAFDMEVFGYDKDLERFRFSPDNLTTRLQAATGNAAAQKRILYGQRISAVVREAGGDPLKFHNILDRNPDLLSMYFEHNPEKKLGWQQDGQYLEFWSRFNRLADRGHWDEAWDSWDEAPQWLRDKFRSNSPSKFRAFEQSSRYSAYMGKWVGLFDTKGSQAAMNYFYSLPEWARERYFSNHPGFQNGTGRTSGYVTMLNRMFDQIDGGNWDAAERIWRSAPSWMRNHYYQNNPDSTLFRGTGGTGGGGISDAKFKQYVRMMGKWVDFQRDGQQGKADAYFRSLPKWAQDFYLERNKDKALLKEDTRMLALLEDYMIANPAAQRAMLENSPRLAKWLAENDSGFAWQSAVQYMYQRLPDDPWLKRVFREKYPEIFSPEAKGKKTKRDVMQTLRENPELSDEWLRQYRGIMTSLEEAMKYMNARPKSPEVDHSYEQKATGHAGMSAADVQASVRDYVERLPQLNKRMPKLDSTV